VMMSQRRMRSECVIVVLDSLLKLEFLSTPADVLPAKPAIAKIE